jgi:phosphopantothenoylcysteine decarboxylase/phosphopantothenate--cysteine ligase
MLLEGKKILVGVCGSIAAYKSAYLVRLLVQSGADVRVVMTPGGHDFVTPLTFATLSKNPVYSDFIEDKEAGTWTNHVDLGLWADLMVVAPLSANTLSKMAHGQSDNFFLATYMSSRCPIMIAPAMDHDMYLHGGTQDNLTKLQSFGHIVLESSSGELASGLTGKGRMAEPEHIHNAIVSHFHPALPLLGKVALVTAGPTYERIDPVRFIGNFSSGKMGFALAESLANLGADVILVSGPSHITTAHAKISRYDVTTAQEMHDLCVRLYGKVDIAVMAAAVADYRPAHIASEKIKKADAALEIKLEATPDIAKALGELKKAHQINVGFALETENEMANGQLKLERKNFDLLVLNSLRDAGAGFGTDTNKITLIWPGNKSESFGLKSKKEVAADIAHAIVKLTNK